MLQSINCAVLKLSLILAPAPSLNLQLDLDKFTKCIAQFTNTPNSNTKACNQYVVNMQAYLFYDQQYRSWPLQQRRGTLTAGRQSSVLNNSLAF